MAVTDITVDRVRELLAYDPTDGKFTWRVAHGMQRAGAIAGSLSNTGYWCIKVDRNKVGAHRLAWMIVHGHWPKNVIDHINGQRADNRLENLRDVPQRDNRHNLRKATTANSTGLIGARRISKGARFQSQIKVDGVAHYLGSFDTPEEAHAAYIEAKRRLHPACTI